MSSATIDRVIAFQEVESQREVRKRPTTEVLEKHLLLVKHCPNSGGKGTIFFKVFASLDRHDLIKKVHGPIKEIEPNIETEVFGVGHGLYPRWDWTNQSSGKITLGKLKEVLSKSLGGIPCIDIKSDGS